MSIESNVMNIIAAATKRMEDRIATLERQNAALRSAAEAAVYVLHTNISLTPNERQAINNLQAALEAK